MRALAKKKRLWTRLLLVAFLSACTPATQPPSQDGHYTLSRGHLRHLDEVIEKALGEGQARGAVVLVSWRGQTVFEKAYGVRALQPQQEEMTRDTIFDMASLTKVMATAPAVMMLVEEGKIALSDRVRDYLPGFEAHGKDSIRLIHLLTHYSGLRPDVDLDEPWEGYETAIRLGLDERPVAEPGERFIYSDINFFLLAEIVRRVSGLPFQDFCRERIFEPLGMTDTGFNPSADKLARIAPSEPFEGQMLRGTVHDPTTRRMGGVAGHAGLFSTAADVARFASMILNQGSLDGARVLSPLSVRAMTTAQTPPGQPHLRGLGFDIDSPYATVRGDLFPKGSFGHSGFTGTSLWIDPSSRTFVILLTSRLHPDGKGSVVSLRKKVASVVAASLRDLP